jgi:hypothetical protein
MQGCVFLVIASINGCGPERKDMGSSNWKNHERSLAKAFGGKRVSRGADFSQSLPDVIHPVFAIEAKYKSKLPKFLVEALYQAEGYDPAKIPVLALKEKYQRGCLIICWMEDFIRATEDFCARHHSEETDLQTRPKDI